MSGPARSETAYGELDMGGSARADAVSGPDGGFELRLVSGQNTFFFGSARQDGTLPLHIPARDVHPAELKIPPRAAVPAAGTSLLHGMVLDLAGNPYPGAEVMLFAGTVGEPSHRGGADREGRFRFSHLPGAQAIAWVRPPAGLAGGFVFVEEGPAEHRAARHRAGRLPERRHPRRLRRRRNAGREVPDPCGHP